jgi:hypothetical protein
MWPVDDVSEDREKRLLALQLLERAQRRRNLYLAVVVGLAVVAFGALVAFSKQYTLYREHYQFQRFVRPGVSQEQIEQRFGLPYRTYWTKSALEPVLQGRGAYRHFNPDPGDSDRVPREFAKVLHYRTTAEHGEFVYIGPDGRVIQVLTARP